MAKPWLCETAYAQAVGWDKQLPIAVKFLNKYYQECTLSETQIRDLSDVKIYSNSPLTKLWQLFVDSDRLSTILWLDCQRMQNSTELPTILTYADLTINGNSIPELAVPAPLQRCWADLTPIVSSKSAYNGELFITDVNYLCELLCRCLCVQTYDRAQSLWLPPKFATFLIEAYSTIIVNVFGQMLALSLPDRRFLQTVFAAYYAQCLGGPGDNLALPSLLSRCTFLGSSADIESVMSVINAKRQNNGNDLLTPAYCCQLLQQAGPERTQRLTGQLLYRAMSSSALDSSVMAAAVDYPPYFLFQLLRCAVNHKNPLFSNFIRMGNMKQRVQGFCEDLVDSKLLIGGASNGL